MEIRTSLASLVEQIAREQVFDEQKYFRFNLLLEQVDVKTPALLEAADDLTEFYVMWTHQRPRLVSDSKYADAMLQTDRQHLLELASAIRRGD